IIQNATFPLTVQENLPTVISYELDRLTPLNADDAYFDFQVQKTEDERVFIIIAAARKDMIEPYLTACKEIGIPIDGLTFPLSGISTLLKFANKTDNAIFLSIAKNRYEGMVYSDGEFLHPLSAPFRSEDNHEITSDILEEIIPWRDFFLRQNKPPLLITDYEEGDFVLPEQKIPMQMKDLQGIIAPGLSSLTKQNPAELPMKAAGGALETLWPGVRPFNLLKKGARDEQKRPYALTVILFTILLIMGVVYLIAPVELEKKRQEVMDQQIALMKDKVKKVDLSRKEVDILAGDISRIYDFKQRNPLSLAIMNELTVILPKTVWLTRLKITDKTVDIEGYATRSTEILPKLETSPLFIKAEFASPTVRDSRMNMDRFIIKMEIEQPSPLPRSPLKQ
ncbi:MAG: PilN domain-containing protein, partial [Syntrophus sp. (in: bacteria)]